MPQIGAKNFLIIAGIIKTKPGSATQDIEAKRLEDLTLGNG